MDRGAWRATVHGVTKESDTTERLNTRPSPPRGSGCVFSMGRRGLGEQGPQGHIHPVLGNRTMSHGRAGPWNNTANSIRDWGPHSQPASPQKRCHSPLLAGQEPAPESRPPGSDAAPHHLCLQFPQPPTHTLLCHPGECLGVGSPHPSLLSPAPRSLHTWGQAPDTRHPKTGLATRCLAAHLTRRPWRNKARVRGPRTPQSPVPSSRPCKGERWEGSRGAALGAAASPPVT